jgi:hypothetical protein
MAVLRLTWLGLLGCSVMNTFETLIMLAGGQSTPKHLGGSTITFFFSFFFLFVFLFNS